MNMSSHQVDAENQSREFICGVVEGFYGKPWSFNQRKDLFKQLKELKLNSFMYAPKDDVKHRAKWRQLYNDAEALALRDLIQEAKSHNIDFYYSLAPGLDMVYSDGKEMETMKKKFDQLVSLGCESFAILFDDIEPSMNEKDAKVFKNYALAQVSVTNEIFEFLKRPKFLFCPTEYCESRAVPNVANSIYLNTIGDGLLQGIDFMWSGCRVISRLITEESIESLTNVIKRAPVIWENLHANDYDKKRVFLGPYSGRSTRIIPKLRGVLTNPNCEYEVNYIAIHTLAQWSKCTEDINLHNQCCNQANRLNNNNDLPTDENNLELSKQETATISDSVYDPARALRRAINDWLPKVLETKSTPGFVPLEAQRDTRTDEAASAQIAKESEDCNLEAMVVVQEDGSSPSDDSNTSSSNKKMDVSPVSVEATEASPSQPEAEAKTEPKVTVDTNSCDSCEMQDASAPLPPPPPLPTMSIATDTTAKATTLTSATRTTIDENANFQVDAEALSLLAELFFLPFEHGSRGSALLSDIKWLTDNSDMLLRHNVNSAAAATTTTVDGAAKTHSGKEDGGVEAPMDDDDVVVVVDSLGDGGGQADNGEQLALWLGRAEKLNRFCGHIRRLTDAIINYCPNQLLASELYPYLVEMRLLTVHITNYVKDLRFRNSNCQTAARQNNPQQKESAVADEQEPWVHRGGLIGDVQRLIF